MVGHSHLINLNNMFMVVNMGEIKWNLKAPCTLWEGCMLLVDCSRLPLSKD